MPALVTGTELMVLSQGEAVGGTAPQDVSAANAETVPLLGARLRCTTQLDKTSNTSVSTVTGLSATLVAGRKYLFRSTLFTTSTVNGGMKVAIGGTATATSIIAEGVLWNGATIGTAEQVTSIGTIVAAAEVTTKVEISGEIVVNAGGTFIIQMAQNASHADTSSVKVGSSLVLEDVA